MIPWVNLQTGLTEHYHVLFGRRDSFTPASIATVNQFLPAPILNFEALKEKFAQVNLTVLDLVTLAGML